MSLVSLNKNFNLDSNFWELNPQLIVMSPFDKLYKRDKDKDKSKSSKEMWMIFFLSDPDKELNKFYRIPYDDRLVMLKETYYDGFKEYDETIQECLRKYPLYCMTAVERALKQEIESMQTLVHYITNIDYNAISLDDIKKLVDIRSKTPKIMDNYEQLEKRFIKQKSEARIRGGRKKSKAERGELFTHMDDDNIADFE